jgi:AcrR family transcriptional regulator
MISRTKLLEAAARVYAEGGFRGATTRRIAEEAGVNEVTIFRLFGSKAQLLFEAMQQTCPMSSVTLPERPASDLAEAEGELIAWSAAHLEALREARGIVRQFFADLEEHPDMAGAVCEEQKAHFDGLVAYARHLAPPATAAEEDEVRAACALLLGAIFADAMGRDVVPTVYPQPESTAAPHYVRAFLRALGVGRSRQAAPPAPTLAGAQAGTRNN